MKINSTPNSTSMSAPASTPASTAQPTPTASRRAAADDAGGPPLKRRTSSSKAPMAARNARPAASAASTGDAPLTFDQSVLQLDKGVIHQGGDTPRQANGQPYEVLKYVRPGTGEKADVTGLSRHNGTFTVFDHTTHEPVHELTKVGVRGGDASTPAQVGVDPKEARLKGGAYWRDQHGTLRDESGADASHLDYPPAGYGGSSAAGPSTYHGAPSGASDGGYYRDQYGTLRDATTHADASYLDFPASGYGASSQPGPSTYHDASSSSHPMGHYGAPYEPAPYEPAPFVPAAPAYGVPIDHRQTPVMHSAQQNTSFSMGKQRGLGSRIDRTDHSNADCGQHASGSHDYYVSSHHPQLGASSVEGVRSPLNFDVNNGLTSEQFAATPIPPGATSVAHWNNDTRGFHYAKIHRDAYGQVTHLSQTDANSAHLPGKGGVFRKYDKNMSLVGQRGVQPVTTLRDHGEFAAYCVNNYSANGLFYFSSHS